MNTLEVGTRIAIKNVLYATDFSQTSDAALPYVLDIARLYGSTVSLVHVIALPDTDPELTATDTRILERDALRQLHAVDRRMREIPHKLLLMKGDVCSALAMAIRDANADLLVVGTHGRTGKQKLLLGSVAEKVFRQATCPVLTVGPKVMGHRLATKRRNANSLIRRVLYATDFTPESLGAAPFAISLAQEHQALLLMLHVIETQAGITDQPASAAALMPDLEQLIPPDADLWFKPEFFIEFGSPADRIVEMAEQLQADLIVLGVRKAKGHLFASTHLPVTTAHKVVANAMCPVLTVLE